MTLRLLNRNARLSSTESWIGPSPAWQNRVLNGGCALGACGAGVREEVSWHLQVGSLVRECLATECVRETGPTRSWPLPWGLSTGLLFLREQPDTEPRVRSLETSPETPWGKCPPPRAVHLHPASFQVPTAVCSLQGRDLHPVTWVSWQLRPTPRPPSTPTAEQLFAWQNLFVFGAVTCQEVTGPWEKKANLVVASGLSHSHEGWVTGRGLSAESGGRGGQWQWSGPSPPGRTNLLSAPLPAQLRLCLGASHPVPGKGPPSPTCCDPAISQTPPSVQPCLVAKKVGSGATRVTPAF